MRYAEFTPPTALLPTQTPSLAKADQDWKAAIAAKRMELDNRHLSVKLKRCRKGTPPNTDWDQAWNEYKRWALANFVARSR